VDRADQSYPPMWGLWTVRWLRGELDSALDSAKDVLSVAKTYGVPMVELTARHAMSFTLFTRGQFEEAIEEANAGLALYDFDVEKVIAQVFLLSSAVCLRASRAHCLWMLGRVVDAESEWDAMLDLGRRLDHRPSLASALAFSLHGGGFRYSYIDQMGSLAGIADELFVLAEEEDFFPWYAQSCLYRGLAAQSLGEPNPQKQMLEGLELWEETGARLTLVMTNVLCAEAFYRMGDDDEAFRRLEVAEAEMRARREAILAPDIWRIRGRLWARQGDLGSAEAAYREAIARARAQRALSLELRASIDLSELEAENGRGAEAQELLAGVLQHFTQGLDRPEPVLASAVLRRRRDLA
jgi:tetratricopeptide (TPR) repeat protein